ncbi:uncharacterized protein SPPG_08335 [Spizellomyces punctatus DAOM BR117]|uniref:Uncharacterized protein n=1 Tax=Spizellomyces punctatus (strain DAOM BR117) TaxID=645134 RepID=A0A0L0H3X5_SPIPD|nr:uncharacterized protein SPPG_08335 [Spizellomyces punctatus DAOM BR117]KNC96180.1 hypothetical protein SPPG_08335 [Spizellomyces punctatus DAOM BR117]|eukprot:XP_016604220.1 hypothetical protein SPPG_08335 [Spizellomyces punctatus DAOM BR117]
MPLNTSPPTCFYTHPPTRPWRRIHESIESMSWGIVCIVHAWLLASGTRSSAFTTLIKGTGIAFTVIGGLLMLLSLLWLVMRVTGMIGYREVKALGDGIVGVGVECDKGLTRAVRLAFGYVFMGSGALVGAIDNYAAASMATVLLLCGIACLFSCKDEDRPVIVLDCDRGSHPKQFISAKTGEIESSAKLRKPVKYAVVPSSYFVVQEEFTCPCKVAKQQQCRFTGKYTQAELVCIACYEAQRMNITHVWMADLCVGTVIDGSHECCGLSNKDQARLIDGRPARIFQNARAVIFPVLACPCAAHNILFPKPWKQRIFDALRGKLKVSLHATHSTPSGNVTTTCVHHLTTSLDTRLSHPSALQELLYARKISIVAAGRHHTSANPDIPNDPSTISTRTTHFQTWFTNVSKTLVSWRKASALSLYLELDRRYTHLQSPKSFDSTVLETQEYTILKHLRDILHSKPAGSVSPQPPSRRVPSSPKPLHVPAIHPY